MTKYETIELELDKDVIDGIQKLADENNATFDEVCRYILLDNICKKIRIAELNEMLQKERYKELFGHYYTIIDAHEKPIARIIPIDG